MPKTKLLVSLLMLAATYASATGCKLDRPTEEIASGAGGAGAICGSGGTGGGIDGGGIDGGGIITVTPAPLCNATNVTLRLPYVQPYRAQGGRPGHRAEAPHPDVSRRPGEADARHAVGLGGQDPDDRHPAQRGHRRRSAATATATPRAA